MGDCLAAASFLLRPHRLIEGPALRQYESAFAGYIGVRHGYSFCSGRVALFCILTAMGIGDGDEVAVQVPTHIVVANAIRYTGAHPVFVDSCADTCNVDVPDLERAITARTKAIVVQHTFGIPADLGAVSRVARQRGVRVIEDCVHALGARYQGARVGSLGSAAFFSTEETKTISTTMGGMAVTDDDELARRLASLQRQCASPSRRQAARYLAKLVAYHALTEPHLHQYTRALYEASGNRNPLPGPTTPEEARGIRPRGYERRLSNAQALLGLRQLRRIEQNLAHRETIAAAFRSSLQALGFDMPHPPAGASPAYVRFPIYVDDKPESVTAAAHDAILGTWFTSVLEEAVDPAAGDYVTGSCPSAELLTRHLVNLPTHGRVRVRDVEHIVKVLTATRRRPQAAGSAPAAGRVLIMVENAAASMDHRVYKQIGTLVEAGHRVHVITRRHPRNALYQSLPGVRFHEYPPPAEPNRPLGYLLEYGYSFAAAAFLSLRVLRRERIDVVQFCQPPDIYFPLGAVLKRLGARVVVDQRDLLSELCVARYGQVGRGLLTSLRLVEKLSHGGADRIICVNEFLRKRALGTSGLPRDRVLVIRNGPVLARVTGARGDKSLKRGRRHLCCWVGMMGAQDRLDLLLRSIDHVVHGLGRADAAFVVIGFGECLSQARALARELDLGDWVHFTGFLPEGDVFRYLASADLGLDASLQAEVSPVKAMEYMAFGLPFVSFDLPETRVISEGAARYVRPGDVEAHARAIDALLDDAEDRKKLGAAGHERVLEDLAWERQAPRYAGLIAQLCAEASFRPR